MINHVWSVLCRESVIDGDTNNISLLNIFEQLEVSITQQTKTEFPIRVSINYELVSLWTKTGKKRTEKIDIEVMFVDPNGQILMKLPKKLKISENLTRLRSRLKISGIQISKSGNHLFRVKMKRKGDSKYKVVAELPLDVKIKKSTSSKAN